MPITDMTIPADNSSRAAYLNGVMVGYGELTTVTQFAEVTNWNGFLDSVPIGIRQEGWIDIIPDQLGFVLDIADNYRDTSFEGRGISCQVIVSAVSLDPPFAAKARLSEVKRRSIRFATLCDRCSYYLRGNPAICNAFHPVDNVTECQDFRTD